MGPEELSEMISKWKDLEEQIKNANQALRVIKQEEKKYRDVIIKELVDKGVGTCNLSHGEKLNCVQTNRKQTLNKQYLKDILTRIFKERQNEINSLNPEQKSEKLTDIILESRESILGYNLKLKK